MIEDAKVVPLLLIGSALAFLLQLHAAHAPDGLFAFNALLLASLEDLLVLYAEFASLDVKAVEGGNDGVGVGRKTKVGKGETTERSRRVKVVVECVGSRD